MRSGHESLLEFLTPDVVRSDRTRELEALLEYLKSSRGFDFTAYKRASLTRRIQKRMQTVGARTYGEFAQLLEQNPAEFDHLCNTVLINVTAFFRDDVPWDAHPVRKRIRSPWCLQNR